MNGIEEYTLFAGEHHIASGDLLKVAEAAKRLVDAGEEELLIIFNNETGRLVDFAYHGAMEEFLSRVARQESAPLPKESQERKGPGRPKLGVVAREVTLLPRHWEWLKSQPGGASATLRRLVQLAMREGEQEDRARRLRDATYHFMSHLAGDAPGFEEAARALYRSDFASVSKLIQDWPGDIRMHVERLVDRLQSALEQSASNTGAE